MPLQLSLTRIPPLSLKRSRSAVFQKHNTFNEIPNRCALARDCHRKNLCSVYAPACKTECRNCPQCHSHYHDFKPFYYHFPLTDKAPFICNNCKTKSGCRLDKYYYRAITFQRDYRTIGVESKKRINISEDDLALLDETVSPLIRQGQSVYMILQNYPEITQCEKITCNYIDSRALSIDTLDIPKKVKYKLHK